MRTVLGRGRVLHERVRRTGLGLLKFYKAEPERLIVVQDEIDLPYGEMRVKFGGGDNGHNGLKSIRKSLGTGDYYRVRVGVGRPRGEQATGRLRARPFSATERRELDLHVNRAADAVESLITVGLDETQNQLQQLTSPLRGSGRH